MGLGMSYSNCQHDFQAPFQRNNETTLTVSDPKLVEAILKVYLFFSFNFKRFCLNLSLNKKENRK